MSRIQKINIQELKNRVYDAFERITAHMLQVFRATVERWQQCFEMGGGGGVMTKPNCTKIHV
jgi:hypothetical protein